MNLTSMVELYIFTVYLKIAYSTQRSFRSHQSQVHTLTNYFFIENFAKAGFDLTTRSLFNVKIVFGKNN